MSDEIKLRKAVERAAQAKAVLENQTLMNAFAELEQDYIKAWRNTYSSHQDIREASWHAVQALADVTAKLNRLVTDGAVASAELKAAGL